MRNFSFPEAGFRFCDKSDIIGVYQGIYNFGIAFLDLSKAFDRVWREGLFYLLWKNGVQGKIWRLLKEIYVGFRFCDKSDIIGVYQGIYNFGRKRDSYVLFFKHI
jgi:hypothetical protein